MNCAFSDPGPSVLRNESEAVCPARDVNKVLSPRCEMPSIPELVFLSIFSTILILLGVEGENLSLGIALVLLMAIARQDVGGNHLLNNSHHSTSEEKNTVLLLERGATFYD